jgi:hypothetical protein
MAGTSGDLVLGIGVVAEQWNREQDGDVEHQKQGAGEGHRAALTASHTANAIAEVHDPEPRDVEFEPVKALLANWQTIGGQEQRTNRVVTLKIEVRDRICLSPVGRIEPTLSQLLSSRDVLREQNSIVPEPTIMLLDLSEAIEPITAYVHRIVSQTQLSLLKRCKFRIRYRSQC